MRIRTAEPKRAHIVMIPLIDSFFLILVYFIYAFLSMSVHRGIPMQLPHASTAVQNEEENLSLSVSREGKLFLNREALTRDLLFSRLQSIRQAGDPEKTAVFLYGDAQASHGSVVDVLDMLRECGFTKVMIETNVTDSSS